MKKLLLLFLSVSSLYASFPIDVKGKMLYLIHRGEIEKAISSYLDYARSSESEDYNLLQEASLHLLEAAMKSHDPESELLAMFGAGIAVNPAVLPILKKGLESSELKVQAVALHFLNDMQDNEADQILRDCLSSPNLLVRFEAALILAEKKEASVVEHMEALYYKVPEEAHVVFAQIIAPIQTPNATKFLQKLLNDPRPHVRYSALIEAGKNGRDDLLPLIQKNALFPDYISQEAAVNALIELHCVSSLSLFQELAKKNHPVLRVISLKALHLFGEEHARTEIEKEAKGLNLYAISLLGDLPKETSSIDLLKEIAKTEEGAPRLNAAYALLKLGESESLSYLKSLLIQKKGSHITLVTSPGKALHFLKEGAANEEHVREDFLFREEILRLTLELSEEDFIKTAKLIFDHQQTDLVPMLMELCANTGSESVIALLKEMCHKTGAPLIRAYCNLALYKLNLAGPYEENVIAWVKDMENHALIQFKEEDKKEAATPFYLNPEEKSQLLIGSFEALAAKRSVKGLEVLLNALRHGNPKNRYALAGLLMRTTE